MVSFKKLLIASSLLFSGIIAIPFPATELNGVEPVKSRAIANYAIGTHDLNPVSIVDIEARRSRGGRTRTKRPKTTRPKTKKKSKKKKTKKAKKAKKTKKTKKAKKTKKPKSCPLKKKKGAKGTKGAKGSAKHVTRGILDDRLVRAPKKTAIEEHEYVNNLKTGDTASVTELSGCTAVYFWDRDDVPIIFHIFCGKETKDGKNAMDMVVEGPKGKKIKEVWIISQSAIHAARAKSGMMDFWDDMCDEEGKKEWDSKIKIKPNYDIEATQAPSKLRVKLTITAGRMHVDRSLVEGRQLQVQRKL
jgi:hypothetical protein